ncbi:MAG TPA: carboxypeptidase-like regulatory domain-containing protein [Candidatus Bathyarchaeia archaeon]|nr:carboxypeptidase-like regulatory domain-containing protein [Candidatus Bathyarchaeia archaeon]
MRSRKPIALLILVMSMVLIPLSIQNVHAVGCQSGFCDLYAQTNVPNADGSIWVQEDNNTALRFILPHLFSFPNGTYHSLEVLNLTIQASSGARYIWKQWEVYSNQWTPTALMKTPLMINNYTGSGSFTAKFDKQFQYTLTFNDAAGQPLTPAPTSLVLTSGAAAITTSTYSGQWLSAASWTVTSATWESYQPAVLTNAVIDLTSAPATVAVTISAYPASVKVVDKSNSPLPGASVTATFANTTTRTFTTDSQGTVQLGHIPLGPYSVRVSYQGQDQGTRWSEDASVSSVSTVTLNVGGAASAPVVSAIVLLTIFGVAFFLVLLAIKLRSPRPQPPNI